MAKLYAILNPSGVLAITYQPCHSGATNEDALDMAEQIKSHLEKAAFKNIRVERNPLKPLVVCVLGFEANNT